MTQHRTAVLAVAGSWLAVVVALLLKLFLGSGFGVLLLFTSVSALAVTLSWSRTASRRQ